MLGFLPGQFVTPEAEVPEMENDGSSISPGKQMTFSEVVSISPIKKMTFLEEHFDENIRPLLDAVDKLRTLKLNTEGISLPSIVVVGDQSSGKSSVLESLATISLPRGQGIATRVPLVLCLQRSTGDETSITISYNNFSATIEENDIEESVKKAQNVLAGTGKGIKNTPINLHIRRPGAPDLTMIDLPGITRVPVHCQPEDIYEQISAIIRVYLEPKETMILNVLSAAADFSTCESIRMAQKQDNNGERTLAVVTKVDRCPEGLYEKVTENDVNIGLGYICVRNRTKDDKNHDEAREREANLFDTHPELSKLEKNAVGIASLAKRLTEIQADIIRRTFPEIQSQIEKRLGERQRELASLTQVASGNSLETFLRIVDDDRTRMENIIVHGIYENYISDNEMHFPPRVEEMFLVFNKRVGDVIKKILPESKTQEIMVRMREMRGIMLPNFLPAMLMKEIVAEQIDSIAICCRDLVLETHEFAQNFVCNIVDSSTETYPKFSGRYKLEARNVLAHSQTGCMKFVERALDKERTIVFTLNDYYINNVKKIKERLENLKNESPNGEEVEGVEVEGFEEPIALDEMINASTDVQSAFEMKVNLAAYWKVVHKRMADEIPLEIRYSLQSALLNGLRTTLLREDVVNNVAQLLEEHPSSVQKRINLKNKVELLMESRSILSTMS